MDFETNMQLTAPVHKIYYHVKMFPIDVWKEGCDWINNQNNTNWLKRTRYFYLEWIYGEMLKSSNINHPCPYVGNVYIRAKNIKFDAPLLFHK